MSVNKYKPYPKAGERPYEMRNERIERTAESFKWSESRRGVSVPTSLKNIWTTLHDTSNPITHPNRSQADHVDSCITGHQRSDGRIPRAVRNSRTKKLQEQHVERKENGILSGTSIYVGGYLAGTTDIEIKRKVVLEGGEILMSPAGATHIITSRELSAAKTHKHLHSNRLNNFHIVTPEWVSDSIEAGKRKNEWRYAVAKNASNRTTGNVRKAHANPSK